MSLEEQHDSKRKRSDSPFSSSTTCEHLREEPKDEDRNKRRKTERPASPAPSYLSLKSDVSMAEPNNFRAGEAFSLDFREPLERPASPTPSYQSLRTDWSMDAPNNFKIEAFHVDTWIEKKNETDFPDLTSERNNPVDTVHYSRGNTCMLKVGSHRAPSPTLSTVSELTEVFPEQPTNFKTEALFPLDRRLLTENHLKCPGCQSLFKDPVSIACGHNFCRDCITSSWDSCVEDFPCPKCGRGSKIRPELNTNTALAEVVKSLKQAGFSPALPACSYAGPEDVPCNFCSDPRLKAVKSCLTCDVSLCDNHIKRHYTIPALQKHTLSDVTGATDINFSSICEQQDWSITESAPNSSMESKAVGMSIAETDVNKGITNTANLELMCSKLQQEVLGLKKSFSQLKKNNTRKDKCKKDKEDSDNDYEDNYDDHVDVDDDVDDAGYGDGDEEYDDDDGGGDDDDDGSKDFEKETDSYDYDDDCSEMYKSDEFKSENDIEDDEDEHYDEYDEGELDDEYEQYSASDKDGYDDESDQYDEYGV